MNLNILLTEGEHNKAFYNTTFCVLCYFIGITLYSVKTYLPIRKVTIATQKKFPSCDKVMIHTTLSRLEPLKVENHERLNAFGSRKPLMA